jgi:16S rRNA (guanine966-N2)-methyltransferase
MRIIAGIAKGRRLAGPPGKRTRPLTDRVREAVFSSLGGFVVDADVLDLYAGTGSIGLEALSRGAASVVFVEQNRKTAAALRTNVATVGLGGTVVVGDVTRYVDSARRPVDLAFVDPPYALPLPSVFEVLERLEPTLVDGAVVVVHRRWGDEPHQVAGSLKLTAQRRYGDADIWRYRKDPQ